MSSAYRDGTGAFPCGHERTEANTRRIQTSGRVRCRECVRRYMRESMQRVRKAEKEKRHGTHQ